MRLGCPARVIHGFAAAPPDGLQVIRYCVGDSEGAGTGFVAFLSPELGAPPIPRGLLSLPIAQHSDPVSVLEIVRGANPMLDITAVIGPSPREPCAALAAPPIAESKSFFEAAPIRLSANRQSKAGGACFEICVADGACQFRSSDYWGVFGEYL
jgi:hypothetical protein